MSDLKVFGSPSRYVQGKNALASLGEYLAHLGKNPILLADDTVWGIVGKTVTDSLEKAGLPVKRVRFIKFATPESVDELSEEIKKGGHDVVAGIGGGSTIDVAKAAGVATDIYFASVPTAASSDAPTSALSLIYNDHGEFLEYRFLPRNPDLVLIDTQVVANAPIRFLRGGIGDALATWIEARAVGRGTGVTMMGGRPTRSAQALAKLCWDTIHENAFLALDAVKAHTVTPALDAEVEANTLLSGLGFESSGLAAAHAIHDGLTQAPQTHGLIHGEKVTIGTLTQLIMEAAPEKEIEDFIVFTTKVGLPNTLTEIGLTRDNEKELRGICTAATAENETIHAMPFPVDAQLVYESLVAIEDVSRRVRAEHGLPEPVFYKAPEA
ncbi:glycerol dehydrogenase [Neoactinobaculum massilliense]|uniref:glycerol dehydrogenase n=1 Tax=Neoactinobaculum massilliense TaxID=2364794 RepID=UPI000F5252EE|nr:glycerol dehydrogenase [Neoactinobaculum massilliense]